MTDAGRQAALDAIAREVAACQRCRLAATRTRAVPGEGNADTEVMFVGEGPGFNEDRQGRPFVGQAGNLLTELLAAVGWQRDEVYITNVVKCRPPENRDPEPDEIAACAPFLTRQLEVLEPALVVTLGRFSMARFNPDARIGQVHGTFREADPSSGAGDAYTFAMYHPAAALHQGSLKQTLFTDMRSVPAALLAAREAREAKTAARAAAAPAGRRETGTEQFEVSSPDVTRPPAPEPESEPAPEPPVERAPERTVEAGAEPAEPAPDGAEQPLEPDSRPVEAASGQSIEPAPESTVQPARQRAEPALEQSIEPARHALEPARQPAEPGADQAIESLQEPAGSPAEGGEPVRDPLAQLTLF